MAYDRPTPTSFRATFPQFNDVTDAAIQEQLDAAPVDETWMESDFAMAIKLWAADQLVKNGQGAGAEAQGFLAGTAGYSRIKSGTIDLSRPDSTIVSAGSLEATSYGSRFYAILRRNKGGVLVTDSDIGCCDPYRGSAENWSGTWPAC